jgi:hypothetical protein
MANVLYNQAREAFGTGLIDMTSDDIRVLLVDSGSYSPNFNTDTFVVDVPALAVVDRSTQLQNAVMPLGVFDADDITVTGVPAQNIDRLIIYQNTGVDATSRLLVYIDTGTGIPVTPSGDVEIQWSASGIFRL